MSSLERLRLLRNAAPSLADRTTIAELYAAAAVGGALPLLGASAWEAERIERELVHGADLDDAIDLRLSGHLVHELCHTPRGSPATAPLPWLLLEAAALHLGHAAFPRHLFPEVPGEAIPAVSGFVLLGESLARRHGREALWSIAEADATGSALPDAVIRVLATAEWQDVRARRAPPFVNDALSALDWVKLAEAAISDAGGPIAEAACGDPIESASLPSLLDAVQSLDWQRLAWWSIEPGASDHAMVGTALDALFTSNRLDGGWQTMPENRASILIDPALCRIEAAPREAAWGEPAHWIFPPPLARRLLERGAQRIQIENATRAERRNLASTLVDLTCGSNRPLPRTLQIAA